MLGEKAMTEILKFGATGSAVRKVTEFLKRLGFISSSKSRFDAEVRKAVKAFQSQNVDPRGRPLSVDGIVGPLTLWALEGGTVETPINSLGNIPSGGSRIGRAALRIAIQEMEAGAKEISGNNRGPWVKKYLNGLAPEGNSWCAGFVSWCHEEAPGAMPFEYSVGARDIRNQFRRSGWSYDASEAQPQPGDIVVWWRGTIDSWKGHIGLVHHYKDGILYTIEGNRGNFPAKVQSYNYVLSRMDKLLGFGRIGLE